MPAAGSGANDAIDAREKLARKVTLAAQDKSAKVRRGRPGKDEVLPAKMSTIAQQRGQTLSAMLTDLSSGCERGTKCNSQAYKNSWNGYQLHIVAADCGVPVRVRECQ